MNTILMTQVKKPGFIFRDEFGTDLAAGSVNGTKSSDGKATRTVVDTYTATEMVLNPGFETAGAGGADIWGSWSETAGDGAIANETTEKHGGSNAAKITAGATKNTQIGQIIAVIPGYSYTYSFWTRGDGTNAGQYSVLNKTDSYSNIISKRTTGVTSTTYTQVTASFTAPVGCVEAAIYVQCSSTAGGIAYFDDVSLLPSTGLLSISGGKLMFAGGKAVSASGDPGLWYDARTRASGLALFSTHTPELNKINYFGFDTNTSGAVGISIAFGASATLGVVVSGPVNVNMGAYTSTKYQLLVVVRSTGYFYFIKGGVYTQWTLLYVENVDTTSSIYPAIANNNSAIQADFVRLAQLPTPFTSDYGIATQRLEGARTTGDAFVQEANALVGMTVTTVPASGKSIYLSVRKVDANNLWTIYIAPDGSLGLNEKVSGSDTSRGTAAAGSIANGQRLVVVMDGTTIKVYANNVLKITYTSATNFATATLGGLYMDGGAVSDIVSWPRTLAAGLQSMLNRYVR